MSYCRWERTQEQLNYHNNVWGRPNHDDFKHFENLVYEVLQCGLSWWLVYGKKSILSKCFDNFNPEKISAYDDSDVERIIHTNGMIKSKPKIKAIICNAKAFVKIQNKFGSFDNFLWSFTNNKVIVYEKHSEGLIPASNGLSDKISKELKKWGFKYLGPIVVYSHLQACGLVNDHDKDCDCYKEIIENNSIEYRKRFLEKGVIDYRTQKISNEK